MQTIAVAFPIPPSSRHQIATQTFGETAGGDVADPHQRDRGRVDRRSCSAARATRTRTARRPPRRRPLAVHIRPKPKTPASNDDLREEDLGDVDDARSSTHRDAPGDEHRHAAARDRDDRRKPSATSCQWPAALAPSPPGAARAEICTTSTAESSEAGGVQPVREIRPGGGDEDAAEQRAGHDRQLVGRAQQRVRARQQLLGDEVRQAGVGSRAGEAGGDPGDQRERDDLPGADRERRAGRRRRAARGRRRPAAACARAGRRAARAGGRSRRRAGSRRSAAR